MTDQKETRVYSVEFRHAKSTENPDWPHESYCTCCGEEWPCEFVRTQLPLKQEQAP